ncbi:MAG: DNA-methyltransferase [Candidatus Heimdallarchaeota archaeon]
MTEFDKFESQTVYYKSSENMSEVKSGSISTIITSPPYNLSKIYSDDKGQVYNDDQPLEEYFAFLARVWKECFRVCTSSGVFFLNLWDSASTQGLSERVAELAVKSGFIRIQTIIWIKSIFGKGHYTPSGGRKRLNNVFENIYVLVKDKRNYTLNPKAIGVPYTDKSNIGRYSDGDLRDAGNVWFIPYSQTTGATIKKGHDAPFPLEVPIKCILLSGGKTVLDPFLGSGTTLAAAEILGKIGYGYEKFPRKNLIAEKIRSSKYIPSSAITIPHLELAVKLLAELNNMTPPGEMYEKIDFRFSKKEKQNMAILETVLRDLDVTLPLMDHYKKTMSLHEQQRSRDLQHFLNKQE